MFKKYFYLFSALLFVLVGCDNTKNTSIFFGGQIINPKTDFVVLFHKEVEIDTFYLDNNNQFSGKLKNRKEGLYYFKHANEYQYIYLEPKDSVQVRLNTFNFDETLVFSGKGAERNNFLLQNFLDSEKESKQFYEYYKLPPANFIKVVDSLERLKKLSFDEFLVRNPEETTNCKAILNIALTYPLYSKIENYSLNHATLLKNEGFPKVTENFYKHRNKVKLNDKEFIFYQVYYKFLSSLLYNKTLHNGFSPATENYSAAFTNALLKTIDKNITSQESKNILLSQILKYHFIENSSSDINAEVFKTFFDLNTNDEENIEFHNLIHDINFIKDGNQLKQFSIIDYTNTLHNLKNIISGKNVVIYFWNPKYISESYIASRINYLISKNNNVEFIGVKMNGNNKHHIDKLDIKNQFFINDTSKANRFLTNKLQRTILINKKGIILNSYASLNSRKIHKQVSELNKN